MKKKYILIILLFITISLFGCNKPNETIVTPTSSSTIDTSNIDTSTIDTSTIDTSIWDGLEASSIEIVEDSIPESVEYDEFDISTLKIIAHYDDAPDRILNVTKDMLDEASLAKLNKAGNPRISINYDGWEIKVILKLTDFSSLDKNLNSNREYNAVIKAIRNKEVNRIDFILEKGSNVNAFQIKYTFDNTIINFNSIYKNDKLINATFIYELNENNIAIMFFQNEMINDEITLFSIDFIGDFRTCKLMIDDTFNNEVWSNETLYAKVLYHVSIK